MLRNLYQFTLTVIDALLERLTRQMSAFSEAKDELQRAFGDDPNVESYAVTARGVRVRLHDMSDASQRPSYSLGVPIEYLQVIPVKASDKK